MRNNSFFRLALLCCIIFALQATVAYADNHTFCDGIDNEIEPPLIFNESYYQAQVASYNEAISENPEDVELLTLRGDGYYALRMYDESLADFSLASELDPESTYALAHWAIVISKSLQ